jgi:hypothetical protein
LEVKSEEKSEEKLICKRCKSGILRHFSMLPVKIEKIGQSFGQPVENKRFREQVFLVSFK